MLACTRGLNSEEMARNNLVGKKKIKKRKRGKRRSSERGGLEQAHVCL